MSSYRSPYRTALTAFLICGIFLIALIAPTPLTSSKAGAATQTRTSSVLLRYSPAYMFPGKVTAAQAVAEAQAYQLISAHTQTFRPYLSAMRQADPAVKVIAYVDAEFDKSNAGTTYPSSWYLRDAHGNRIFSIRFHSWLMDPTNPSWQNTAAQLCRQAIASSGYDGCLLDALGDAALLPSYVSGYPINPHTHTKFTVTEWLTATAKIAATVKAGNPGKLIVPNGLADGSQYFGQPAPTSWVQQAAGAGMAEIWLRISTNSPTAYRPESQWLQDVKMMSNSESHGWTLAVTCKLWSRATAAQVDAWNKYSLATYLLAANGHSYYSFTTAQTYAGQHVNQLPALIPQGAYTVSGLVFTRVFTNARVVVNEGSGSISVTVPSGYVNFDGSHATREVLGPHSGDVFYN
jgi:hypothetical protein